MVVSTQRWTYVMVVLQKLFEEKHLKMIQESVVDLRGFAVVNGILPEQQV